MKFFSAAPISTPTFRPAQFPAPQRQSAATDTGTQPTPQEPGPVVTGFKPETRSKNVQLASPSAVAPDPQVVNQPAPIGPYAGPAQSAPVMPLPVEPIDPYANQPHPNNAPIPHPSTQQPFQPGMHGLAPTDPNHPAMVAWNQVKDAAVQRWRETGQWVQPPSYQSWYDQNSWNFLNPLPIPREGGLIATQPTPTTTTVAPQQGMVVPKSARFMDPYAAAPAPVQPGTTYSDPELTRMQAVNGQGPKPIIPAAQAAKYTAARNRSGIYTGLAR